MSQAAPAAAAATVFALATPPGRGAVAIMRLTGPECAKALSLLTHRKLPPPRQAVVRRIHAADGSLADEALVLWMPGPGSFTGEDCAELHLHGGPAIVSAAAEALSALGLRAAEPGEFTRRAFEHGKLDLAQAEAVADLVDAESPAQREQALAQLGGALSRRYEAWRQTLLDALALLEAEIDFPDEDVPIGVGRAALPPVARVAAEMAAAVADMHGERTREGFRVALIGAPNVGKSSLLNALVGRDAAIVTDIAGTTRDVVEVSLILGGQAVVLADTAGLRATLDVIEAEGVRRARAWADDADLRIGVVDAARPETWPSVRDRLRAGDIVCVNKVDLVAGSLDATSIGCTVVAATATPVGTQGLRATLVCWIGETRAAEFPAITRGRHRDLLSEASAHLQRLLSAEGLAPELGAEDVRLAIRSLERVAGRSDPEAVLDRVFASFCIGK